MIQKGPPGHPLVSAYGVPIVYYPSTSAFVVVCLRLSVLDTSRWLIMVGMVVDAH